MAKSEKKWKRESSDKPRVDVLDKVADRFISALSEGKKPWRKAYQRANKTPFFNAQSKKAYKGINQMLLAMSPASESGDPRWLSWKQLQEKGYKVRKGEPGTAIVFWKQVSYRQKQQEEGTLETQDKFKLDDTKKDQPGDLDVKNADDDQEKKILVAREYYVWNGSQLDGIEPWVQPEADISDFNPNDAAQMVISESGAHVVHGNPEFPLYSPVRDRIEIYPATQFESTTHYYATLLHELTHWTGHESRTGRIKDREYVHDNAARAKEELVAEIGSYLLMGTLGIEADLEHPDDRHVAYVQSWIEAIQGDKKRAIWRAVKEANQAVEFIASQSPTLQAMMEFGSAEVEEPIAAPMPAPIQQASTGTVEAETSAEETAAMSEVVEHTEPDVVEVVEHTEPAELVPEAEVPVVADAIEDMHRYVLVAAESVEKLRKIDVFRVMNSNLAEVRAPLARYIAAHRPDLVEELDDVMCEEFRLPDWRHIPVKPAPDEAEAQTKALRPAFLDEVQDRDGDYSPEDAKNNSAAAESAPVMEILSVSGVRLPSGDWLQMSYGSIASYGLKDVISERSLITPEVNFQNGQHWSGTVLIAPEDYAVIKSFLAGRGVQLKTEGLIDGSQQHINMIRKLPSFDAAYLGLVIEEGRRYRMWGSSESNPNSGLIVTVTDVQPDKVRLLKADGGGHSLETISLLQYIQPVEAPQEPDPLLSVGAPQTASKNASAQTFDFG